MNEENLSNHEIVKYRLDPDDICAIQALNGTIWASDCVLKNRYEAVVFLVRHRLEGAEIEGLTDQMFNETIRQVHADNLQSKRDLEALLQFKETFK